MAKNTDKSNITKKEQPAQSPPALPPVTQPITQLRENVNKGETRQVDTPNNTDK
jgi:hypothetical protein